MKLNEVIYFGYELNLLEAHLDTHRPYFNKIYVAESDVTVSGLSKPLYFQENKDRFKKYDVEHIIVPKELFPKTEAFRDFRIQDHNKNIYMHPIARKDCDWVLHSDTDEINYPSSLDEIKRILSVKDWEHAGQHLTQLCSYVNLRMKKIHVYRWTKSTVDYAANPKHLPRGNVVDGEIAGWHFHNCFSDPIELYWKIKNRNWWVKEHTLEECTKVLNRTSDYKVDENLRFNLLQYYDKEKWTDHKVPLDKLPKFIQNNPNLFPIA